MTTPGSMDLSGFAVDATDGSIGKVDKAGAALGADYIVVNTGRILGKNVVLPAEVISNVDVGNETVYVDRTRDQVKNSPEFGVE